MDNVFELKGKISLDTSEYTKGLSSAKSAAGNIAKVGVAAFAAVGTAATAAGVKLVQETGNVASYGDNIDKMSQKMGISAKAYQEWDAVMQHSGTSMSVLKTSMKTLSNAAEQNSEAFTRLGISQEQVANLSKEDLFAKVIEGLQNMEEGTERTYLAGKLLGRGATELGALLNTSAKETQQMKDRVNELGGVMSDEAVKAAAKYQDQLQDMNTAIDGLKRNLLTGMMPAITTVMSGITNLASGKTDLGLGEISKGVEKVTKQISKITPVIVKALVNVLPQLGKALVQNISAIVPYLPEMISTLVSAVVDMLPDMITVGIEVMKQLTVAMIQAVPVLIQALPDIIKALTDGLVSLFDSMPEITDMLGELIGVIADTLIDLIPVLVEASMTITEKMIEALTEPETLFKLVEMAGRLIIAVAGGLLAAVPKLLEGVAKIISAVVTNITSFDFSNAGSELIGNITSALQGAADKLTKWWDGWSQQIGKYAKIGWDSVVQTWSAVGQWFLDRWEDIKRPFVLAAQWFGEVFTNAINGIKTAFSTVGDFFVQVWDGIKGTFSNVAGWFSDIFTKAWDGIKNVFAPVGQTFQNIGDSILNGLKSIVNALITGINNVITIPFDGLNSALRSIRDVDIIGNKPFSWLGDIPVPQIPYLAKGGVLKKGQTAFLEGQGDEAVIPLSQNTEWIDKVAEKLSERKVSPTYNITVAIDKMGHTDEAEARRLADYIMQVITEQTSREGAVYA